MRKALVLISVAAALLGVGCAGRGGSEVTASDAERSTTTESADISVEALKQFLGGLGDAKQIDRCPLRTAGLVKTVEKTGEFDSWTSDEPPDLKLANARMGIFDGGKRVVCPYLAETPGQATGDFNDSQVVISAAWYTDGSTDDPDAMRQEIVDEGLKPSEWSAFGGGSFLTWRASATSAGVDHNTCTVTWLKLNIVVFVYFANVQPYRECESAAEDLVRDQLPQIVAVES